MSMTKFRSASCSRTCTVRGMMVLVLASSALAAFGQQPTPQQQNAIRQSCRGDFQANCAGVPTGGSEALQCLKQNFAKVSPACQKALAPVGGGGGATSGAAPASAPADGSTTSSAPARAPAAAAAGQGGAMAGGGNAPTMREEVMLTRELCGPEFRSYCSNVQLGGGRAMQCLEANAANLSPRCKAALMEIRARK